MTRCGLLLEEFCKGTSVPPLVVSTPRTKHLVCKLPVHSRPHGQAHVTSKGITCPRLSVQQDEHVVTLREQAHSIGPLKRWEPCLELLSHTPSTLVMRAYKQVEAAVVAQWREYHWTRCQLLHDLALEIGELRVGHVVTAPPPERWLVLKCRSYRTPLRYMTRTPLRYRTPA